MTEQHKDQYEDEISLLDLAAVFVRRSRLIVVITLATALVSAAIVVMLPNRYKATATLLIQQRSVLAPVNAAFTKSELIIAAPMSNFTLVSLPIFIDLLQSESVMQSLVRQFSFPSSDVLKAIYKVKFTKSGALEVTVEDTDPQRAANIANAAVKELGRVAYAMNFVSTPQITTERDIEKIGRNETTIIKMLEPASVPTHKFEPKRGRIVALATVSSFFVGVIIAFVLEGIANLNSKDPDRWKQIFARDYSR